MKIQENPESGEIPTEKPPKLGWNGVYVRAVLFDRLDISWNEKGLILLIDSFEKCFASNKWLAKRLGFKPQTIANMLTHLRSLELVHSIEQPNSRRKLVVDASVAQNPVFKKRSKKQL